MILKQPWAPAQHCQCAVAAHVPVVTPVDAGGPKGSGPPVAESGDGQQRRERGAPDEVDGALITEVGAEFAAFPQAGPGLDEIGPGDGRAHGEQVGRDQGRGADLAGQRERSVRQRDRAGHVIGEQVSGHGDGELSGGVGEVAAGLRDTGGLFGEAGGVSLAGRRGRSSGARWPCRR